MYDMIVCVSKAMTCASLDCHVIPQGVMGDVSGISPLVTTLPALLAKSCSCYNPFVYAISHPKFRQVRHIAPSESLSFITFTTSIIST